MAKKNKDTSASAEKEVKTKEKKVKAPKVQAPVDPVKTQNLIRLLNLLALILAVIAFLLQLFAVLSHHWKWQTIDLRSIIAPHDASAQASVHDDSRLDQNFGLFSREVKLFANNDEQLDVYGSTRFPRVDDGDDNLHHCLSQTSTLRGVFLTCSKRVSSPEHCHCRRYAYWNAVIVFEILALIFLGLVVCLTALLTTHLQEILKLAGAGLALLAFIFLLIGLILILAHLKRETRSFADAYPHISQRLINKLGLRQQEHHDEEHHSSILRRALRREASDIYRVYPLVSGQYPFNETHFVEFSEQVRDWVYKPYVTNIKPAPLKPLSQLSSTESTVASTPKPAISSHIYGAHGPLLGYDTVYDTTKTGIGFSTILSILAMVLALLLPLLLIFSWLTGKKLAPNKKTITNTDTDTKYIPVSQEIPLEPITAKPIPTTYNPERPIGDAIVTARHVAEDVHNSAALKPEFVTVRNVIIPGGQPVSYINQEQILPVTKDLPQTTQST